MVSQGFFSGSASASERSGRKAGDKRVALGGDSLGSMGGVGAVIGIGALGIKGIQSAVEGGKRLKENIERRVNPERETSFVSPSGNEVAKIASSDLSGLKVESKAVQVANLNDYTKPTYTPSYPGDDYEDAKPKRTLSDITKDSAFQQALDQGRFGSEAYKDTIRLKEARRLGGEYAGLSDEAAIDRFKRKNIDYKRGEDFFGDKLQYDTKTLKRYMAADSKEKYDKREKTAEQLSDRRINRIADEAAYRSAYEKFEKPSLTDRVSNFILGTDKKGEADPMNKYIVSQDERFKRLRDADKAYRVPGISVNQYGFVDVPQSKLLTKANQSGADEAEKREKNTFSNDMSSEEFNKRYDASMTKFRRVAEGKTPNPNILERTQNFLGGVVDNVSKIFTPRVEAGTLEGKPTRFTMGESNVSSLNTPSVGNMISNIGAGVEAGGMGGLARPETSQKRSVKIGGISFPQSRFGKPQARVLSPMEAGMGPGAARARAMAKARIAAKKSGTATTSMSGADRAKAMAKARIARKKSASSGTGFGRSSSSSSRRSTGRAGRRGGSAGSAGSRSRGSTGSASRRSSSSSRSSNTSRSRRGGQSSSRGGSFGGSRRRGGRRGRRGGRRCDLRCKVNISLLTSMNLMRDDLAEVAYFVKELQEIN